MLHERRAPMKLKPVAKERASGAGRPDDSKEPPNIFLSCVCPLLFLFLCSSFFPLLCLLLFLSSPFPLYSFPSSSPLAFLFLSSSFPVPHLFFVSFPFLFPFILPLAFAFLSFSFLFLFLFLLLSCGVFVVCVIGCRPASFLFCHDIGSVVVSASHVRRSRSPKPKRSRQRLPTEKVLQEMSFQCSFPLPSLFLSLPFPLLSFCFRFPFSSPPPLALFLLLGLKDPYMYGRGFFGVSVFLSRMLWRHASATAFAVGRRIHGLTRRVLQAWVGMSRFLEGLCQIGLAQVQVLKKFSLTDAPSHLATAKQEPDDLSSRVVLYVVTGVAVALPANTLLRFGQLTLAPRISKSFTHALCLHTTHIHTT